MTINELEQKVAELQKEVEKMKVKKVIGRRLDEYWCISEDGSIEDYNDNYTAVDNYAYSSGNYFATKEQAEKHKQKLILTQKYKDFIDEITEVPIGWNDKIQSKWYLFFRTITNAIQCVKTTTMLDMNIYTTNENLLQLAKERFTDEELKIIIGVE